MNLRARAAQIIAQTAHDLGIPENERAAFIGAYLDAVSHMLDNGVDASQIVRLIEVQVASGNPPLTLEDFGVPLSSLDQPTFTPSGRDVTITPLAPPFTPSGQDVTITRPAGYEPPFTPSGRDVTITRPAGYEPPASRLRPRGGDGSGPPSSSRFRPRRGAQSTPADTGPAGPEYSDEVRSVVETAFRGTGITDLRGPLASFAGAVEDLLALVPGEEGQALAVGFIQERIGNTPEAQTERIRDRFGLPSGLTGEGEVADVGGISDSLIAAVKEHLPSLSDSDVRQLIDEEGIGSIVGFLETAGGTGSGGYVGPSPALLEDQRQFDLSFPESIRQYEKDFEEGLRQFQATFDEATFRDRRDFEEAQRLFAENFAENQRQFNLTEGRLTRALDLQESFGQRQADLSERRLAFDERTAQGAQQLEEGRLVTQILSNPADFLARAFSQRGETSPFPQVTQQQLIDEFAPSQRFESGGHTRLSRFLVGEGGSGDNAEVIENPTGAPIRVIPAKDVTPRDFERLEGFQGGTGISNRLSGVLRDVYGSLQAGGSVTPAKWSPIDLALEFFSQQEDSPIFRDPSGGFRLSPGGGVDLNAAKAIFDTFSASQPSVSPQQTVAAQGNRPRESLVDLVRRTSPPAVSSLLNDTPIAPLDFDFALPTPQRLAKLTPDEQAALNTRLAAEFNTNLTDVLAAQRQRFGGSRRVPRLRLAAL